MIIGLGDMKTQEKLLDASNVKWGEEGEIVYFEKA